MYSPRNTYPQRGGMYSPLNNSPRMYSPRTPEGYSPQQMFSHRNMAPDTYLFSPRNSYNRMGSPRNGSPLQHQVFRNSFNRSRNSSEFNSTYQSFSSNESSSPRGKPYNRNNQNQGKFSNKSYDIRDYINPSMVEDPWAALKAERAAKLVQE